VQEKDYTSMMTIERFHNHKYGAKLTGSSGKRAMTKVQATGGTKKQKNNGEGGCKESYQKPTAR
jgi:hypothetical protein